MLYSFIDRVEVHAATGGRTIYRQQHIDIHFNFIGSYYPPVETVSEEERIAAIDAAQKQKKQEKGRRLLHAERRSWTPCGWRQKPVSQKRLPSMSNI